MAASPVALLICFLILFIPLRSTILPPVERKTAHTVGVICLPVGAIGIPTTLSWWAPCTTFVPKLSQRWKPIRYLVSRTL